MEVSIICLNAVVHEELAGEGILELNSRCTLRNTQIKLQASCIINEKSLDIRIPIFSEFSTGSLTNKINGYKHVSDQNISDILIPNDFTMLENTLNITKHNSHLKKLDTHDVHHYVTIYICIFSIVILFCLYICKNRIYMSRLSLPRVVDVAV